MVRIRLARGRAGHEDVDDRVRAIYLFGASFVTADRLADRRLSPAEELYEFLLRR